MPSHDHEEHVEIPEELYEQRHEVRDIAVTILARWALR